MINFLDKNIIILLFFCNILRHIFPLIDTYKDLFCLILYNDISLLRLEQYKSLYLFNYNI